MGPSEEYLVDLEELNNVCRSNGLIPVNKNLLEPYSLNGKTEFTNTISNVIPFESIERLWKPKENSRSITSEELELNSLYISILFQKKS